MTDANITDLYDYEVEVFRGRLSGKSIRQLAREHHIEIERVEDIVSRHLPVIDAKMRAVEFKLQIERCGQYLAVFHARALEGDANAGALCLKIVERLSALWGLDSPKAVHVDLVTGPAPGEHEQSSTTKIERALQLVIDQRPKPNGDGSPPAA